MSGAQWTALPASGIARMCEIHPGLVALPGSGAVLEPPVVVFSSDREPCRRALSPELGRGGISISLAASLAAIRPIPITEKGDA